VGIFCSNASCKEQLLHYDTGCEALMIQLIQDRVLQQILVNTSIKKEELPD
jgi:hypothetical protein